MMDYRCHCTECTKLDRLPARKQGIVGAWQSSLFMLPNVAALSCEQPDEEPDMMRDTQTPDLFSNLGLDAP